MSIDNQLDDQLIEYRSRLQWFLEYQITIAFPMIDDSLSRPALLLAVLLIESPTIPWVSNIDCMTISLSIDRVCKDSSTIDRVSDNPLSTKWIRSALSLAPIARFVEYWSRLRRFVAYQTSTAYSIPWVSNESRLRSALPPARLLSINNNHVLA